MGLWLGSLAIVIASNLLSGEVDLLTLIAACIGITSLIFAAKGNAWAQILMILFSILYGIISWRFHYWGEMITYLGMSLPMAVWSMITWLKHLIQHHFDYDKLSGCFRDDAAHLLLCAGLCIQ